MTHPVKLLLPALLLAFTVGACAPADTPREETAPPDVVPDAAPDGDDDTVQMLSQETLVSLNAAPRGNPAAQRGNPKDEDREGDFERAVCLLLPVRNSGVSGIIHFTRKNGTVEVTGTVLGLTPGKHGFHIHEYGDMSDMQMGMSVGTHYNPTDMPHGRPEDEERHVGDLGNIEANEDGIAVVEHEDPVIRLGGPHSIIGRSIVVHEGEDQFTQPTGEAGPHVAIGVIGIGQPTEEEDD